MNRREPRWLEAVEVLHLHARQIERYGGTHGLRDRGALESALARALNLWAYGDATPWSDLAASYLTGAMQAHAFVDGNKRAGLAAALVFLDLNGRPVMGDPAEAFRVTWGFAAGQIDEDEVAGFFRRGRGGVMTPNREGSV